MDESVNGLGSGWIRAVIDQWIHGRMGNCKNDTVGGFMV
jgi:hypothetical protein